MHTRVDMAFVGREAESYYLDLAERSQQLLETLTQAANCHDAQSELSVAQKLADKQDVTLSPLLADILQQAMAFHAPTLGLFDISFASLSHTSETLRHVHLNGNVLRFTQSGICLNLSGFLKGYALDSLRRLYADVALDAALVSMGGSSVMAIGSPPHADGWPVAHRPSSSGRNLSVNLHDGQFLTTSGNDSPQRRHIHHPLTGKVLQGERQISVITSSGALGEALSTALFIASDLQRAHLLSRFPDAKML